MEVTAYGILITDKLGYPLEGISEEWFNIIKKYDCFYTNGITDCPSNENPQLVLGFETYVTRRVNFKEMDEKWKEEMSKAPQEIRFIANSLKRLGFDTDIHFLE
jgi:hypothetical protein